MDPLFNAFLADQHRAIKGTLVGLERTLDQEVKDPLKRARIQKAVNRVYEQLDDLLADTLQGSEHPLPHSGENDEQND